MAHAGSGSKRRADFDPEDDDGPILVELDATQAALAVAAAAGVAAPVGVSAPERLDDERVAAPNSGANIVSIDGKQCTHEVAWPPGQQGSTVPPPPRAGPAARQYPFPLDPFQQVAINSLEAGHSVLVAAHTSAGKTVVAEYAFAMALRDKARVVYTSPLKALSNQKYRELHEEFHDVGLMTGDTTINPQASCLVMTTEILRSMLYRGSEVVREVALIVYDEVHYLRDKERGVVWEESIILAPKSARFAFLSATIPNALEFAQWVAKVHSSPCHVVYTDYRPTPLQHYLFPAGGDGLFMVVDEKGTFRDDNFQKAVAQLNDVDGAGGGKGGKGAGKGAGKGPNSNNPRGEKSDIFKIVRMIMERNYDPVIVFSFSKKECERLAMEMHSLDLTTDDEKKNIEQIYASAMACLSQEDTKLGQLMHAPLLLKRGIGVHHSGLLPILKEVTEILFGEGLLKVLFATETFSTGLNMPAKTVVFTNVKKFDGGVFRWVRPGEYIQMSGRAGRRGLDDRGVVILMLDTKLEPSIAKDMIKGAPDNLVSEFHLGYNMLLSLMRVVEGANPEDLMGLSFRQFQVERSLPRLQARVTALEAQLQAAQPSEDAGPVSQYLLLLQQLGELQAALRLAVNAPQVALPFLQPGRLVRVLPAAPALQLPSFQELGALQPADGAGPAEVYSSGAVGACCPWVWGAVVNFERVGKKDQPGTDASDDDDGLGSSSDDAGGGGSSSDSDSPPGHQRHSKGKDKKSGRKKGKDKKAKKSKSRGRGNESDTLVSSAVEAAQKAARRTRQMSKWVVDVLVQGEVGWNGMSVSPPTLPPPPTSAASSVASPPAAPRLPVIPAGAKGSPHVVSFPLTQVDRLSSVRIYIHKDLRPQAARTASVRAIGEAVSRLVSSQGRVPLLDPEDDLKLEDRAVRKLTSKLESVEAQLLAHPMAQLPQDELLAKLVAAQQAAALEQALNAARREAREAAGLIMKEELRARLRVLRRLGYVDKEGVVSLKGRVAADLQLSADELVLCEMVFSGVFNNLSLEVLTALASCFVWREKSEKQPALRDELMPPLGLLKEAARRVARISMECNLPGFTDPEEYVASFRPDIMEPVAAWVRGVRFLDLTKMTTIFEGSLVRAVRRLEELLRQLGAALANVGDVALSEKFEQAAARLRRDVIFAPSLYLQRRPDAPCMCTSQSSTPCSWGAAQGHFHEDARFSSSRAKLSASQPGQS